MSIIGGVGMNLEEPLWTYTVSVKIAISRGSIDDNTTIERVHISFWPELLVDSMV